MKPRQPRTRAPSLPEFFRHFRLHCAVLLLTACIAAPVPAATPPCEASAADCRTDVKTTPARRAHGAAHRPRRAASDPDLFTARGIMGGGATRQSGKKTKRETAKP